MVVVQRKANLFEMIAALGAASSFAGLLHGREQQRDEHGDNGNHHKEFDEGETDATGGGGLAAKHGILRMLQLVRDHGGCDAIETQSQ